jgi:hypothetical protein
MLFRHRFPLIVILLGILFRPRSSFAGAMSPRASTIDDELAATVSPPKSIDKRASRQTTTVAKAELAGSERPMPATRLLEPESDGDSIDYAAVERLRRCDPRYARLELDVRDGRIVITCTDGAPEAAWELAGKITPHIGGREIAVTGCWR